LTQTPVDPAVHPFEATSQRVSMTINFTSPHDLVETLHNDHSEEVSLLESGLMTSLQGWNRKLRFRS
jgi:hypothetical protein